MLIVVGEALVDIVNDQPYVGGSPLNVAVGLARLGRATQFVTRVGNDVYGHLVTAHLEANDVTIVRPTDDGPTSMARVILDPAGVPEYDFSIHWDLGGSALPVGQSESVRLVHTGSIATMIQPGANTVLELLSAAREHAVISYDPNCRPSLVTDRAYAIVQVEAFVRVSDIVKASDEDLRWLYPDRALDDTLRAWIDLGVSLAVVTLGQQGARAITARSEASTPGVRTVVSDTVGAGDSFMAALIDWLITLPGNTLKQRQRIATLPADELTQMLEHAAHAAAITVSRPGANPPTKSELLTRNEVPA